MHIPFVYNPSYWKCYSHDSHVFSHIIPSGSDGMAVISFMECISLFPANFLYALNSPSVAIVEYYSTLNKQNKSVTKCGKLLLLLQNAATWHITLPNKLFRQTSRPPEIEQQGKMSFDNRKFAMKLGYVCCQVLFIYAWSSKLYTVLYLLLLM